MRPGDLDASARPERSATTRAVDLDGELVVYDESTGALHRLDRVASLVWPFLDGTTPIAELAADLAAAFEAPPADVLRDVLALVRELGRVGLLAGVDADDAYRPLPVTGAAPDAPLQPYDVADPPST